MNRLYRVLHRWKATTAAEKSALDALQCLGDGTQAWAGLLLWNVESFFRGVNAPESDFGDHTNHVYFPEENWGGAVRLARKWYWTTVEAARSCDWPETAYAAGVLARYAAFTCNPLRTGHDENALALCRPAEWCLSRHYDVFSPDLSQAPPTRVPVGDDWLERLLTAEAETASQQQQSIVEHFDLEAASHNIPEIDEAVRAAFATQLSRTASTLAAVFSRAFTESATRPPRYPIALAGLLAVPSLPLFWMTRQAARRREHRVVQAMVREFRANGKIEETLPDETRAIREAYDVEILKKSASPIPAALRRTIDVPSSPEMPVSPSEPRAPVADDQPAGESSISLFRRMAGKRNVQIDSGSPPTLTPTSPIGDAPSIEKQHVAKFEAAGIRTIGDLLDAEPESLSASLHPIASSTDIATWQEEARLCCEVGQLTPAESQLLVACGVTGPADLAALSPVELWELVVPVAESPDGRRLLRGQPPPDLDAITRWIDAAKRLPNAA